MSGSVAESDLIAQAIAGNTAALETLLHRTHKPLLRFVELHLPNQLRDIYESSDIVQDTWLRAARSIDCFRYEQQDNAVFRWLVTIARRVLIDCLKQRRTQKRDRLRIPSHSNEDGLMARLLEELVVYKRTPSLSAASHELMASLDAAMARIAKDQAKAVRLRYLKGLAVGEIAEQMERSKAAIHLLCNRGLKALRWEMRSASMYV
jgi:RNA polymerase sigma-70 factor, ECF subfamily